MISLALDPHTNFKASYRNTIVRKERFRRLVNLYALRIQVLMARGGLDLAIFLYKFIHEVRFDGVRALIAIVHIRKFYEL